MILNSAARAAYAKAIALDTQIDARVIRADGSAVPTMASEFEGLKDASERAWADYREEKDAMMEPANCAVCGEALDTDDKGDTCDCCRSRATRESPDKPWDESKPFDIVAALTDF